MLDYVPRRFAFSLPVSRAPDKDSPMANELDPRHLDKRVSQRYIDRGALSQKDLEKHLKSLPDLADKADKVTVEQPERGAAPTR